MSRQAAGLHGDAAVVVHTGALLTRGLRHVGTKKFHDLGPPSRHRASSWRGDGFNDAGASGQQSNADPVIETLVYQELAAERCPEDLGVGEHRKDDVIQGR